jgi:hypothetical protein
MVSQLSHSAQSRQKLKLRPATFEDHREIANLESHYGLDPKPYDEWTHLWLGNPWYRKLRDCWDIGWVVEDERHRIVGSLGNIPLSYEFAGRPILAATGRALVVEPAFRSAAMLLLARVIQQPGIDLYLNNTIGGSSAASFAAFECRPVPSGVWDQAAFWIVQPREFLERFLRPKLQRARMHSLAKPLSYPLAAGHLVWNQLADKSWAKSGAEIVFCRGFDRRFDEFWEDFRQSHRRVLLAVRTSEVLDWHFRFALAAKRVWVAAVMQGQRIAAYAIFERKDSALGISRMRLVDFQGLQGGSELLTPLISWALAKCREQRIQVLEATGRWLERGESIAQIAPYRRRLSTWTYFYHAHDPELAKNLRDRDAWLPSLYDGDASL